MHARWPWCARARPIWTYAPDLGFELNLEREGRLTKHLEGRLAVKEREVTQLIGVRLVHVLLALLGLGVELEFESVHRSKVNVVR